MRNLLDNYFLQNPLRIAERTRLIMSLATALWNAQHDEPLNQDALHLSLCDETRGDLTEEQKCFVRKCSAEVDRMYLRMLCEQESVAMCRPALPAKSRCVRFFRRNRASTPALNLWPLWAVLGGFRGTKEKAGYGYLPKSVKKTVDEIVDQMERISVVSECYDKWLELQGKVESYYHDKPQVRVPLSQQKEFRQIKNAVIQEAENLRLGKLTFEDREMSTEDEPEAFKEFSFNYWGLQDTIRNERLSLEERDKAVAGMKEIAEAGDVNAQYLMGKLWRDGPLLTPDSVNARYWFTLAAEQGHALAQYALGKLLLSNNMEVRDPEQGIRWLERSAEQGNPHAHYRLGKEYLKGEVVEKDTHLGMNQIYTAALDGHAYAQYLLGKLLLQGQVMKQDREEGFRWLEKAAEQGHAYAQFFVERQSKQTPPNVMLGVSRVLHHMSRIFRDNALPQTNQGGLQIDRKRRKQLQRKRVALGHKANDHEDQRYSGPNLSM